VLSSHPISATISLPPSLPPSYNGKEFRITYWLTLGYLKAQDSKTLQLPLTIRRRFDETQSIKLSLTPLVESNVKRNYRCVSISDRETAELIRRLKFPDTAVISKTKLFSLAFNSQLLGEISLSGEWSQNLLLSQPGSEIPFKIDLKSAAVKPEIIEVSLIRREVIAGAVRAEFVLDKLTRSDCCYLTLVSHALISPISSPGSFQADSVTVDYCLRFRLGGAVWDQFILLA